MTKVKEQKGWVGRSVPRKEDRRLVGGFGRYTDDMSATGQLYCAILRSTVPHARLKRVDTSKAKQIPGVVLAISGEEAKPHWNQLPPAMDLMDMKLPQVYALATDKVHYEGEPIAAIAATSRYIAEDALAAIEVEYEELPALVDVEEAMGKNGKPPAILYETWGHNIQCDWTFAYGDVEKAFAEADLVLKDRIRTHRYSGMPMETRAVLADFDRRSKRLTVRASTQFPHQFRTLIAAMCNLPEPNVQVLADDVGGGFGNKLNVDVEVIPVLLSMLTERPVKWMESRTEFLMSGAGARDYFYDMEVAFRKDGTILAIRNHEVGDVGCDGCVRMAGVGSLLVGGTYIPGPYKVQTYATRVQAVVTNKAPYGAYRGYGKDNANFGMERMMDQAAQALGMDRLEIRRKNLVDEFPYNVVTGPILESGSFLESLDELEKAMDLPALRQRQAEARKQGKYLGIGLVSVLEPGGAAIPNSVFNGFETASVRITPDGQVMVLTGMQHIGQGLETGVAQVAADQIGCTPDDVRVVYGDTNAVPYGLGSYASRGATFGMTAVYHAAKQVREKLLKAAGNMLEAHVDDLEAENGYVFIKGAEERRLSIAAIAKAVYLFPGPYAVLPGEPNPTLEGNFVWTNPQVKWSPDEHGRVRLYPAHSCGAEGALVEVDIETGEVKVEQIWLVHDVGTMINPAIVDQQIVGSTIQGFGGAMLEQLKYDENGRMIARTLNDYQLPNMLSAPPISVVHLETPSPVTPLGTKGVGEGGCIGTSATLMAAVEDALSHLGVKVTETPLTPPRILRLIQEASR